MKVEIDADELCSLRADLRALMEENANLGKVNTVLNTTMSFRASLLNGRRDRLAHLLSTWETYE